MAIYTQGNIIHLNFTPAAGSEFQGPHYALVVSASDLNETGCGLVCPITQGAQKQARKNGLTVSLMNTGLKTQGVVLTHQVRYCDFAEREAGQAVETVPKEIMDQVLERIAAIFNITPG